MREAKKLKKGDIIGLVGTSGIISEERLIQGIEFVKSLGFNVIVGESCSSKYGYLSGSDEIRARDLNEMFSNQDIRGIFCMRGGYGAPRIMDKIDYDLIKKNPKIFIGYSDITALHTAFNQKAELITYHSPMPSTEFYRGVDEKTLKSFLENIMDIGKNYDSEEIGIRNIGERSLETVVEGIAVGELTGGNLTLIASMLGTPYEIDCRGKILFLEDIDEEPYRIDRMMSQLRLAGKFEEAAGIILGCFTNCEAKQPEKSLTLDQVVKDILVPAGKPILKNLTAGHCLPTLTLPLGKRVRMDSIEKKIEILN